MEINDDSTAQPPQPQPLSLPEAVKQALETRGFKPKCSSCSAIGWANLIIPPLPSITLLAGNHTVSVALLVCLKCGQEDRKSLEVLGIGLQESRIITPEQMRQQKSALVMP